MGQSPQIPFQDQLIKYEEISVDKDNNLTYLRNIESDELLMIKKQTTTDKQVYQSMQDVYQIISRSKNENIVKLKKFDKSVATDLCTQIYEIYSMWEHHQNTLDQEILVRKNQGRQFNEKQISSVAFTCISALSQMEKNSVIHGKLSANTIKLPKTSLFSAKLSHPLALPTDTNWQRVYRGQHVTGIYISPQQCNALANQNYCAKSYKSDVWTLGLILLQMALLNDQSQCYQNEFRRINWTKIYNNLDQVEKLYGSKLRELIGCMLENNTNVRPTWTQLKEVYLDKPQIQQSVIRNFDAGYPSSKQSPQVMSYKLGQSQQSFSFSKPGNVSALQHVNLNQNYNQRQPLQIIRQNSINSLGNFSKKFVPIQQTMNVKPLGHPPVAFNPPPSQFNNPAFKQNSSRLFEPLPPFLNQNHPSIVSHVMTIYPNSNVKKFISPASCQGFLFQKTNTIFNKENTPVSNIAPIEVPVVKQQKSHRIEQTRHQPIVQAVTIEQIMSNISKLGPCSDIKNAQSITYQQNINNFFGRCNTQISQIPKQCKQVVQKQISPQVYVNKLQPLVTEVQSIQFPLVSEHTKPQKQQKQYKQQQVKLDQHLAQSKQQSIQYVVQNFDVGSRYQGYKLGNMRHGQGRFYYQDGGMYDGHWEFNKMHGKGMLYYQSGTLAYDGQWKNDQFQGKGKLYNQSPQPLTESFTYQNFDQIGECWQYYEGEFVNDLKQGRGKLMLTNGEYYIGNFTEDMIQGNGKFFGKQGMVKGYWEANQLQRID